MQTDCWYKPVNESVVPQMYLWCNGVLMNQETLTAGLEVATITFGLAVR